MDDVVPEGIHHQLAKAVRIVQLIEVLLADAVSAALKALFHHVRTELLNGKDTDLANNALTDRVDFVVTAYVQNVLNYVVAVGVLHQLEGLLHNPRYQVRPGGAMARVQASLDDAAAVTMTCHVFDARGDSIEDKLCILVWKLQQYPLKWHAREKKDLLDMSQPRTQTGRNASQMRNNTNLNGMIAMAVDAQSSGGRLESIREDLGGRFLPLVVPPGLVGAVVALAHLTLALQLVPTRLFNLLVHGAHLHYLLNGPRPMQVQARVDEARAHAAHERHPLRGRDTLQYLLEEVIAKGINHGLGPEGQSLVEDGGGRGRAILVESLLEETASHLIAGEATDVPQ